LPVFTGTDVNEIQIGAGSSLGLPEGASAQMLEMQGTILQYHQSEIANLVEKIGTLGTTILLTQKNVAESGLARSLEQRQGNITLMSISQAVESAVNQALRIHADYTNSEPQMIQLDRNFSTIDVTPQLLAELNKARAVGDIDRQTFVEAAAKALDATGLQVDTEEILERLDA